MEHGLRKVGIKNYLRKLDRLFNYNYLLFLAFLVAMWVYLPSSALIVGNIGKNYDQGQYETVDRWNVWLIVRLPPLYRFKALETGLVPSNVTLLNN